MYSMVQQALAPRKQIVRIKVLNIFTPDVIVATLHSRRVAPTKLYLQLEELIARVWQHSPGWQFTDNPTAGTFVIAMLKNKSNFKRGVIMDVTQISGRLYYYVFLYDWGIIERFTINDIAKLPAEQQSKLEPRTFIVVYPGMVEVPSNQERLLLQERRRTRDLKKAHRPHYRNRGAACAAARTWFEDGDMYIDTFKIFEGIVLMADLKRRQHLYTVAGSHHKNESYSDFMENKGYCKIDSSTRRADQDRKTNNWESVSKRIEKIQYDKVVNRNGLGKGNEELAVVLKDMAIFKK